MKKEELDKIAAQIKTDKKSVNISKRAFVNALGCEKRTSGNCDYINKWLEQNNLMTVPSYVDGYIDEKIELKFKYQIKSNVFQLYFLQVNGYKNLNGFSVSLEETDGFCCFIGLNGSGKSNVLEVVSKIFFSLYHIATLKDGLRKYPCEFNYTIRYVLNNKFYEIIDGKSTDGTKITLDILPKNIIASYSGEDTRLWKTCYKPIYEKYCSKMVATAGFTPPFMFYLSHYEWEISLLTLLYSEDVDVVSFIDEITNSAPCTITFDYKESNVKKWEGTDVEALIDELKKKKTYSVQEFRETINNISFIDQASTLFYCLYKCRTESDNQVISKINISFDGKGTIEGLSEGEKKLINTNAVIHILSTKDSLCMFDEPDAHIHIAKQVKLRRAIDIPNRYSLVTTHSPMFLNMLYTDNNIRYMDKGQVHTIDKLKQINTLSEGLIDYFEGAFILSSKRILVTEGKYDGKYIKKAIDVFSKKDEKYKKLNDIAIMQAGGANNVVEIYKETLKPIESKIEKLVFLFDYDQQGFSGSEKVKEETKGISNVENLFYQLDYSLPTDKKPENAGTIMVEDLFSEESYSSVITNVINCKTHKDFRTLRYENAKSTSDAIKNYIEKEYQSFEDKWFEGFKPLLNKLIEIYNL